MLLLDPQQPVHLPIWPRAGDSKWQSWNVGEKGRAVDGGVRGGLACVLHAV